MDGLGDLLTIQTSKRALFTFYPLHRTKDPTYIHPVCFLEVPLVSKGVHVLMILRKPFSTCHVFRTLTTELGALRFPVMVGHYVPLSNEGRTMEEFL